MEWKFRSIRKCAAVRGVECGGGDRLGADGWVGVSSALRWGDCLQRAGWWLEEPGERSGNVRKQYAGAADAG